MKKIDDYFEYELGDKLKDIVTGFSGVVMVRAEYSTGCIHYGLLNKKLVNNKPQAWEWIDQSRLVLVGKHVVDFSVDKNKPSGSFPSGPES